MDGSKGKEEVISPLGGECFIILTDFDYYYYCINSSIRQLVVVGCCIHEFCVFVCVCFLLFVVRSGFSIEIFKHLFFHCF